MEKGITGCVFLIRDLLFSYTFPGSWFLSALIIAVTLIFLIKKANTPDWVVAIFALTIYLLLYNYKFLPEDYQRPFNVMKRLFRPELSLTFIRGIPWVVLGYFLSDSRIVDFSKVAYEHKIKLLLLFVLSFFISVIWNDCKFFMQIFMVLIILVFAYNAEFVKNRKYLVLRRLSILFYFLHFPLVKLTTMFNIIFPNSVYKYFFILFLCSIFSYVILTLQKYKMFSWLKYAY